MKVAFINPPWVEREHGKPMRQGIRAGSRWPFTRPAVHEPDAFRFGGYIPAPMFLMFAAAWMQRERPDWRVVVRDSIARGESYTKFFLWLEHWQPDAVVLETGAASWEHDKRVLRLIRERLPKCRIAVSGPPAADMAKSTEPGLVDAWALGEYEKTALAFADGASGIIPFHNLARDEMASQAFPMFDEEVWANYYDACPKGLDVPELTVWGSRGCFALCNFCAWPAAMTNNDPLGLGGRKIRFYPRDWLEGFITERQFRATRQGRPIRHVRFDGDTENASDKHTREICAVMRKVGIPFTMMCRADTSSDEVWRELKESGCVGVKIGFESGSQRVVNEIVKKGLDLAQAAETCRMIRKLGMTVHGTFTIGLPGETAEEARQTIAFIDELKRTGAIDTNQLSGTAEIPGTPLSRQPKDDARYVSSADGQRKIEEILK